MLTPAQIKTVLAKHSANCHLFQGVVGKDGKPNPDGTTLCKIIDIAGRELVDAFGVSSESAMQAAVQKLLDQTGGKAPLASPNATVTGQQHAALSEEVEVLRSQVAAQNAQISALIGQIEKLTGAQVVLPKAEAPAPKLVAPVAPTGQDPEIPERDADDETEVESDEDDDEQPEPEAKPKGKGNRAKK